MKHQGRDFFRTRLLEFVGERPKSVWSFSGASGIWILKKSAGRWKALVSCWRAWEKRTASSPQLTLTFRFCFFAVSRSKGGKPLAASFILTRFSARMRSASSPAERVARTLSGEEKFIEFLFYPAVIGESIGKGWVEMRPDVVEGHPDFEFQTTAAFSAHVEMLLG